MKDSNVESSLIYVLPNHNALFSQKMREAKPTNPQEYRKLRETLLKKTYSEVKEVLDQFLKTSGLDFRAPIDPSLLKQDSDEVTVGDELIGGQTIHRSYQYKILYCAATLKDGTELENCILYPYGAPTNWDTGRYTAAGSVTTFKPSKNLIPKSLREAAYQAPYDEENDERLPLVGKIGEELRYLIPANEKFVRYDSFGGRDLDPQTWEFYDEDKKQNYIRSESLFRETTLILAEGF